MTDIFDEVEDDLRRQRAEQFWKRYWRVLVAAAVLLVAAVGGWRFYEWRQAEAAAIAGARFEQAMRVARDTPAEAGSAFSALVAQSPQNYQVLARFRAAAEMSDVAASVAAYDALASDASIGQLMQDVARIRAAIHLVDTAPLAELNRRLEPLAAPGQAYRHSAREILALAAMRASDKAAAERWLSAIQSDADTPAGVRGRAELIAAVVGGLR